MNVRDVQRKLWGAPKEGKCKRLLDYELKIWPDSESVVYAEKSLGSSIAGKVYELDDEEMKKTDLFVTEAHRRISAALNDKDRTYVQVYVKASSEVAAKEMEKAKKKKVKSKRVKVKRG